jgi:hypothetical protein
MTTIPILPLSLLLPTDTRRRPGLRVRCRHLLRLMGHRLVRPIGNLSFLLACHRVFRQMGHHHPTRPTDHRLILQTGHLLFLLASHRESPMVCHLLIYPAGHLLTRQMGQSIRTPMTFGIATVSTRSRPRLMRDGLSLTSQQRPTPKSRWHRPL